MPELPEVEIMTEALDRWVGGRRVRAVRVEDPRLVGDAEGALPAAAWPGVLAGARVRGVRRRAKYSLLDLDAADGRPWVLVLHYRMTGKPLARSADEPARRGTRLVLSLAGEGPEEVAFVDPRCLGDAWLLPAGSEGAFWAARDLGPEPWPVVHDGAWWQARLAGLRGAIKPALLRQDRVAGLGNICAAEALWRAGIDPRTKVPEVSPSGWDALAAAVPAFIDHVVETEGAIVRERGELDYVNAGGPNPFDVYGREGEPCPRCGGTIARIPQSGRSTWWCPGCQG